jgi:hypothetical protein
MSDDHLEDLPAPEEPSVQRGGMRYRRSSVLEVKPMVLFRSASTVCVLLVPFLLVPGFGEPQADQLWSVIKQSLLSEKSQQYFDDGIRDALLPRLKGTVVSATPTVNPAVIVLALSDQKTAEVTLHLIERMPRKPNDRKPTSFRGRIDTGDEVEFSGIGTSFQKSPFMLTFDAPLPNFKAMPRQ